MAVQPDFTGFYSRFACHSRRGARAFDHRIRGILYKSCMYMYSVVYVDGLCDT